VRDRRLKFHEYRDNLGQPGETYWDGQQWHTTVSPAPARDDAPSPWHTIRRYVDKAQPHWYSFRHFWSGLPRHRQVMLGICGLFIIVASVALPVLEFNYLFGGPPLTGEQRFVQDLAVAGIVSDDPGVKADVNLPASAETTASIVQIATGICADLNNGTSTDDEAMQLYQSALSDSFTTGFHLSHDNAVTIVRLAVQDVCPGK